MCFRSALLVLAFLTAPVACERNKTVRTVPRAPAPAVEARAEPEATVPLPPDRGADRRPDLPRVRPEETEDETGIDGDRPAPTVEPGPELPPTMPPR